MVSSVSPSTVSIVIPLYNKGPYIRRSLSSVLAQTYPPFEVIVVDDGSSDGGPEMVLACHDPRIILVRQENQGPASARNTGLALAKGQYVAFLDADDEWHPPFLETVVSYLEIHKACSFVATGYVRYPKGDFNSRGLIGLEGEYEVSPDFPVKLLDEIETFTHLCFTLIKTNVAKKWGGYFDKHRCTLGEDQYFFIKLILNETLGIIPEPYGIYHMEASELWGCGFKAIPPLTPLLSDPEDVIRVCPPCKLRILEEYLFLLAFRGAIMYSKLGRGQLANQLIDRFCRKHSRHTLQILMANAMAEIAPILPSIRRRWRSLRQYSRIE